MSEEFRRYDIDADNPIFSYWLSDYALDFESKRIHRSVYSSILRTEEDIIKAWSEFARDSLENGYCDAGLPSWAGHYEQFGMVMLNLANMARYGDVMFKERWIPFYDSVISLSDYETIYSGPNEESHRYYCRVWFALFGHPDFFEVTEYDNCIDELSQEFIKFRDTLLALSCSLECFQKDLRLKCRE